MSGQGQLRLVNLLDEIRSCTLCKAHLPLGPRPVVAADAHSRILVIGQAPGARVHETGIPWNDPSGDRLRQWMGLSREQFYDTRTLSIMPMGFCYPGRGRSGDLPPRPECAPTWHERLLAELPKLELVLLVGAYAQGYYLDKRHKTLGQRVRAWQEYGPLYWPLVHPSPRNRHWLGNNPWFERELVPALRQRVAQFYSLPGGW